MVMVKNSLKKRSSHWLLFFNTEIGGITMRNKAKFIEDFEAVAKPEIVKEVDPVQDAAHTMNHIGQPTYTLSKDLTKTGKDETFKFEVKKREKTDNPAEKIDDYFYVGKGE